MPPDLHLQIAGVMTVLAYASVIGVFRPAKSHNLIMRLMIFYAFSQSHD